MKNKTYWLNRAIDRQSTIDKLSQVELNEIRKIYDSSQRELNKMLNEIYDTYSRKAGLDVSELKKLMSYADTDKFWKSLDGQKMQQYVMNNYKSRITRIEAYKAQLQAKCNALADKQEQIMSIAGRNAISSSFRKTVYDTSIGVNVDLRFTTLDDRTIDMILKEKWLGSNYSDRVWNNTNQLAEKLKAILTKTVMTGGSQSRAIRELRDAMNSEWYKAERLVRTEMNHFHNQAELQAYEEMGVEEYVYVATLDNRTSEICQELDGKKFKLSEAEEGVNYPPMHPYCRSTVRAYISKDVENDMQRRARDPQTGENSVISNMSYSEWMTSLNNQGDVLNDEEINLDSYVNSKNVKLVIDTLKMNKVDYNEIQKQQVKLSEQQIIDNLGGGDMTQGSCASLGLAYCGNKNGYEVLDFRNGASRKIFSTTGNLNEITTMFEGTIVRDTNDFRGVKQLLPLVQEGKEYYLYAGRHAAIIKKVEGSYQYLELQSATDNGWHKLTNDTFKYRFGCRQSHTVHGFKLKSSCGIFDVDNTKNNKLFDELLGYINTDVTKQVKGVRGVVR